MFRFANKIFTMGKICRFFRVFPDHLQCLRGASLAGLTGNDKVLLISWCIVYTVCIDTGTDVLDILMI